MIYPLCRPGVNARNAFSSSGSSANFSINSIGSGSGFFLKAIFWPAFSMLSA